MRWFKFFEQAEAEQRALSATDFHTKALVDHILVTLLVERGEKPHDRAESALLHEDELSDDKDRRRSSNNPFGAHW